MYGASGPLAMEEKTDSHSDDGIPGRNETSECDSAWCHGEANFSGLTKETAKTQLERFYGDGCVDCLLIFFSGD